MNKHFNILKIYDIDMKTNMMNEDIYSLHPNHVQMFYHYLRQKKTEEIFNENIKDNFTFPGDEATYVEELNIFVFGNLPLTTLN